MTNRQTAVLNTSTTGWEIIICILLRKHYIVSQKLLTLFTFVITRSNVDQF